MDETALAYARIAANAPDLSGYDTLRSDGAGLVRAEEGADLDGMLRQGHGTLRYMEMGAVGMMGAVTGLGLAIPGATGGAEAMRVASLAMVGAMGVMSLLRGAVLARQAWETAAAIAETAAQALVQNWGAIALAGATAAVVFTALEASASSSSTFTADYSTPAGRRAIGRDLGSVPYG